ncbi:MAG TPA: shikimate kinase [Candidatus Dormibacteraeota bacterium]|nr:shikimate kinase [Candidatus Dormibacteraeota bacterium]
MTQNSVPRGVAPHPSIICLAGFMGSGKTTIGTLLARQLAWRFVDLDDRIEESSGLRISEFFERFGEQAFRALEADQLRAILGRAAEMKESVVLALGGGTYAQQGAPEFLRAQGIPVIWLDASVESLLSRCMTMTGRPLFRDETSFRALYTQRVPSYQLADHRVDSSGDPALVVAQILRLDIFDGPRENYLVVEKPRS